MYVVVDPWSPRRLRKRKVRILPQPPSSPLIAPDQRRETYIVD